MKRVFGVYLQKFQVESWNKELYGQFYNGDSYIALNVCLISKF